MRQSEECHAWVVYRMTLSKGVIGGNVCEQREWDALELARPASTCSSATASGPSRKRRNWPAGRAGDTPLRKGGPESVARNPRTGQHPAGRRELIGQAHRPSPIAHRSITSRSG